jgi:hypothetical protein
MLLFKVISNIEASGVSSTKTEFCLASCLPVSAMLLPESFKALNTKKDQQTEEHMKILIVNLNYFAPFKLSCGHSLIIKKVIIKKKIIKKVLAVYKSKP